LTASSIIQLKDVSFAYSRTRVLENVSLSVAEGDIVSVIGPNGGGKTTLIKLILGLISPGHGEVLVYGKPPRESAGFLGYVPQHSRFDDKFPITVYEVVITGRLSKPFGFYTKKDREAVWNALELAGLTEVASRPFQALSGGQRQRVLIARALADNPSVLIMDEPTSNVDAAVGNMFRELLENLSRTHTILLATHDVNFVDTITNRVFCVNGVVHEHPVDHLDPSLISRAYGSRLQLVRHDINIEEHA